MSESNSLEDLIERFLERCRAGEVPDEEAFAAGYPEHRDELLRILPLMMQMEGLRSEVSRTVPISASPELPDTDYRLLHVIGAGGMGTVYEALQISLNRKVAVKVLSSALLKSEEQRSMFENEARVIAMLHHPNIIKVLSAGCGPERCYYAMELVQGKGLDECGVHDPQGIARLGLQAAEALAYAHRCGILHRDIKPANLLLDSEGQVRVGDFGIAFVLHGAKEIVEEGHSRSGTLRFMSPERLANGVNSFSSDLYSLGASLYELATGKPILAERTPEELMKRIRNAPLSPLKSGNPDFDAIINKSTAYFPEDRYSSMDEFAADLRRFLNHEPVRAANPSLLRRFTLWIRRKPAVACLTFAAVFCAAAFVVALTVGYIRTSAALKLAEENAQVADSTLSQVFRRIAEQPPTKKNAELLSTLLPYYRTIAGRRGLPPERLREANAIIGECSMRTGSYSLATEAFAANADLHDPASLNRLAEALKADGQAEVATKYSHQVVNSFADSGIPGERFEAVRALLSLSASPESPEGKRAFRMLEQLLAEDSANPEYRFQYARLLGANPRLFRELRIPGVEPNALRLLLKLCESYPERPEYGVELMNLSLRRLRMPRGFSGRGRSETEEAVALSERLLGRFPNDPALVSSAVQLHSRCIELLRRNGEDAKARKETDRLLAILEILFHNPEVSDDVRENLIQLQLERLELFRHGRAADAEALEEKIRGELESYHGSRADEFRKALEKTPENEPRRGNGFRRRRRVEE